MSAARAKGTRLERIVADGFAGVLDDDRIDRAPLHGSRDIGDIAGLRSPFGKVAVEVKNTKRLELAEWVKEADTERGNLDAIAGVVIHKRRGKTAFEDQYVTMTVRDLLAIGWGR